MQFLQQPVFYHLANAKNGPTINARLYILLDLCFTLIVKVGGEGKRVEEL